MYKPIHVLPIEKSKIDAAARTYLDLCNQFLAQYPDHEYSGYIQSSIANEATRDRHVRAVELYAPYVQPTMKLLDWGCRHAPDSCLLRGIFPQLELSGCDFGGEGFSFFYDFAKVQFQPLQHEYQLPYADNSFDAVVGSGVLEHVAFEHESLREIWRILKPDGCFFVTFLPNSSSISERAARLMGSYIGHNRLYNLEEMRMTFLRTGFVIERCGFHQVFPTFAKSFHSTSILNLPANLGARLNRPLEAIPVINRISSNLFFVLRRALYV